MCTYVKGSQSTRIPKRPDQKKEPDVLLNNQRASRLRLKRNVAEDPAAIAAYDELYRIQRINQVAHEDGLPVTKVRKEAIMAKHIQRIQEEGNALPKNV